MYKNSIFLSFILIIFISCDTRIEKKTVLSNEFICEEYWLPKNVGWETAYDDVLYAPTNKLIIKSKDSSWGLNWCGTILLDNDTIRIGQELGYDNSCFNFGKVKNGDSLYINIKKEETFKVVDDVLIEYEGIKYKKVKYPTELGCSCKWKSLK